MTVTRRSALLAASSLLLSGAVLGRRSVHAALDPRSADVAAFLAAVRAGDLREVQRRLAEQPALAAATDERGLSAFLIAHLEGRPGIASVLRATGLELDLVEAVFAEEWERVEALAQADPGLCDALHPIGGTPLYAGALAATTRFWQLRSLGCGWDAAPAGGTGFTPARGALEHRTITGAWVSVTDLLSNGSDVNAPQRGGDSVLHGAVRRRSDLLVRLAVRKGADVTAADAAGRTALDLARELAWAEGVDLLEHHERLPRDHRASRFAFDAAFEPVVRPDMSGLPQELQSRTTGSSHARLEAVRELVARDERLVFSISTDEELAIEASAHTGNGPVMRFHLEHGAPLSLPTAVSLGDAAAVRRLLDWDPLLVHERGAHDFPVMCYVAHGGGGPELAALLHERGVAVDQESQGATALHWCARRDDRDLAAWLLEHGADVDAVAYTWDRAGQTPLAVAREAGRDAFAKLLTDAGARG